MAPTGLLVLNSALEFSRWRVEHIRPGVTIGLVATKGGIHSGHYSLSRQQCDVVIVSIARSEGQFANIEDFRLFPHEITDDINLLQKYDLVDALVLPKADELFKYGPHHGARIYLQSDIIPTAYVDTEILENECTILTKVLNVVRPTRLYLSQKDLIRTRVTQRLIDDLLYPIDVVATPIARNKDGVAFDARFNRLSSSEKMAAAVIYRALKVMVTAYLEDVFKAKTLIDQGRGTLAVESALEINFVRVAHPYGFQDIEIIDPAVGAVAFISVNIGKVTLIDNVILAPLIPAHEQSFWSLVKSAATDRKKISDKNNDKSSDKSSDKKQ